VRMRIIGIVVDIRPSIRGRGNWDVDIVCMLILGLFMMHFNLLLGIFRFAVTRLLVMTDYVNMNELPARTSSTR
jgi:hypothetical protein